MKSIVSILLIIVVLFFIGCSSVSSQVTVFHNLSKKDKVIRYSFSPSSFQKNNLAYSTYRKYIQNELSKHKFKYVPYNNATVLIKINYVIDNGKVEHDSRAIYGQTGIKASTTTTSTNTNGRLNIYNNGYGANGNYNGVSQTTSKTTYTPKYGVIGYENYEYMSYTRKLRLLIVKKNGSTIYDGTVVSSGSTNSIYKIMPYLIEALFKVFPGENGKTRKVDIFMDK